MASYGTKGENFIFHIKNYDADGFVLATDTPTITIFTFGPLGVKIPLDSGSMSADPSETGRWVYSYEVPSDYVHQSNFYGLIEAVDPSDGTKLIHEETVVVLERDGDIGNVHVITPPVYLSHWNSDDGSNGDQSVSSTISPTSTARIPTPSGGEGNPFKVGAHGGTNQTATTSYNATFTTPNATTGFGNDSTMKVDIYDADSLLDSYTTNPITSNGVYANFSGSIAVTISEFGLDDPTRTRYKAKASVATDVSSLLSDGGFYRVEITHSVDTSTDSGEFGYSMSEIFIDSNPDTPSIGSISFLSSTPIYKYLSGLKYYDLNSTWTISVNDIDNLNSNSIRVNSNINITSYAFSLPDLDQSPFGTGSGNFSSWTNDHDVDNVSYVKTDWQITTSNHRTITNDGYVTATPKDTWASGTPVSQTDKHILIDTYPNSATDTSEPFNDESRRQDSGWNSGASAGNWDSTQALVSGEALVQDSKIQIPTSSYFSDWTVFQPSGNPDYSALSSSSNYYRTFVDTSGSQQPNFTMLVVGEFVTDAVSDLENNLFEIFIRRVNSPSGDFGVGANALVLHGDEYNVAFFDDGVSNGNVRLGSSSGGTIEGTFGGYTCQDGVFFHIRINDPRVKIDSVSFNFPN